jgi:NitT/TauT family transport system substrate-binding protein
MFSFRSRQTFFTGINATLITLVLAACTPAASPTTAPTAEEPTQESAEPTHLQVVVLPFLSFAPFYIAQEEGYFTEQNLDVEFVEFEHNTGLAPALAQGEIDVVSGFANYGMFSAMSQGANIRIVADKGYEQAEACPANAVAISPELVEAGVMDDPSQIAGKTFELDLTSLDGYLVEPLLTENGLTFDDFEIVEGLDGPTEMDALQDGSLDLVLLSEPWITRNLAQGVQILAPINELHPDYQTAVVFYGSNLLEKDRDAGERFMAAYLKAVHQYNEGKTERNIQILADSLGLEADFLNEVCWPHIHDDAKINAASLVEMQDWAVEHDLLDKAVPEEDFWDPSFIDAAASQ